MDNADYLEHLRQKILKRLQETENNGTVCLNGWETRIIIEWIKELGERA